uniref:Myb-like domain-containing protein n=1 Tax=Brassica oleracea var. oleracea TaxID=109376 RepID=A0A0D3CXE1_BRAOL
VTKREDEEIGYASLSIISLSLKLSSTKGDLTSPSVTLLGDVSFGVSHWLRLLRWHFSATTLGGSPRDDGALSRLLVLSLGGSSPPSFPSVAQIEAFTSNRKIEGSKFIEQRFKQFRSSLHNKSSSFLHLLNSQVPHNDNPTQFLSFSPTPDVGGSASRAQTVEDRKQRCKWSTAEDLRIGAYYNASPKVVGLPKREKLHCKQRWGKINEGVCKFVGSYDAATKQRTSGQSEDDVLKAAHEIFLNYYKSRNLWFKEKDGGEDQSFQSSTSMPSVNGEDEATARPIGVKASKAKAKRSVGEEGKNLQNFQQMLELKAKDIASKEKLSQTKLLDKLLAKTEPLSDLEVALKNKLIKDMLYMGSSHTQPEMEPRKRIVCGLSARGIIPSLSEEDRDDDVVPLPQEDTVEVVEISDEEEEDMVDLSREEYMSNMGYLIKVEESEDDIEPEFRRMLERMKEEEKKLREEKFKVLNSGIKLEKGQSSKGDGNKRKRRRNSLSPLQKCTAAIRVLAYGFAADMVDEYLRLGETTGRLCVEQFVEGIIYLFGDEYLRRPTPADLQRLLDVGERRGFPGMIGSID